MDARTSRTHDPPVRVLTHIRKLDDALGDFIVRVTCPCGASRHIEPEALARLVGGKVTLAALATRMRCSQCGKKAAAAAGIPNPLPTNPFLEVCRRQAHTYTTQMSAKCS